MARERLQDRYRRAEAAIAQVPLGKLLKVYARAQLELSALMFGVVLATSNQEVKRAQSAAVDIVGALHEMALPLLSQALSESYTQGAAAATADMVAQGIDAPTRLTLEDRKRMRELITTTTETATRLHRDLLSEVLATLEQVSNAGLDGHELRGMPKAQRIQAIRGALVASSFTEVDDPKLRERLKARLKRRGDTAELNGLTSAQLAERLQERYGVVVNLDDKRVRRNLRARLRYHGAPPARQTDKGLAAKPSNVDLARRLEDLGVPLERGKSGQVRLVRIRSADGKPRNYRLDHYAKLLAHSATRSAASVAAYERITGAGITEVRITSHTRGDKCDICKRYDGKLFSLGEGGRYPQLDRLPPFHPFCGHSMTAAPQF